MSVSSKDRKSIIWHYNGGHSPAEMAEWSRFHFISESEIAKVVDEYQESMNPKPTRADDPKTKLADVTFSDVHSEWERDSLMDDLIELVREES